MHPKTYSEETSPRERPAYFVQSPPNADVDKASSGSGFSPVGSPVRAQTRHVSTGSDEEYRHSRGSWTTSRCSEPLKNQNPRTFAGYSSMGLQQGRRIADEDDYDHEDDIEMDGPHERRARKVRFYICLIFAFALAFSLFCLILWGASRSFSPKVTLQGIVFESMNVQSGSDGSGVTTDMLNLNSTVRILYRNTATFFAVHVTSSPVQLSISQLTLASGQIEEFTQKRKSQRIIKTNVYGDQVPLYGGIPLLYAQRTHPDRVTLPLNLTFTLRTRAYVLGRLVKSKFYSRVRCAVVLRGNNLGKNVDLSKSCSYK
ncbi:PREDICTED: uncharacterized protein LOC104819664 [Tarenaya hassleriana]|uniref:uncharacterized protein LOC104819664 n=1 Tax=Tarenaya hassleriana TaxID=28532 RepID=UPI00053CA30C|nr:PREDICTED: uncharacterized protein LOC104819664 [Tarenaya hassleriana]